MDSILVQLFSSPQQIQASSTNIDPIENEKLEKSWNESMMLDMVMSNIASPIRLPIDSLNTKYAINEVATISKLFSNDICSSCHGEA